ncbi:unnamed protein product [marine sediment metagenome]|uniref:Uncharacterized protein n=1 Tax=marine sediment metagenome TaxID=412755 RepID=X1K685_9ZZZZ
MPNPINRLKLNATVKAYPAVSDLQAISGFVRKVEKMTDVGAPNYDHDFYTVPAGRIFVMEMLSAYCWQATPTFVNFILRSGGVDYGFYLAAYGGAFENHMWADPIKFDENEIVRIHWTTTLAATDVVASTFGYLIDKY